MLYTALINPIIRDWHFKMWLKYICDVRHMRIWCVAVAVIRFQRCRRQLYEQCTWAPTKRHDGPAEAVLLRKNTALPGHSQSVLVGPGARTHTDKLKQPNQLYLKEVGSLNTGMPARQSMCACVLPYPARVGPGIPPRHEARPFYNPGACAV